MCQEVLVTEYPEAKFGQSADSLAAEMTRRETQREEAVRLGQYESERIAEQREKETAAEVASEIKRNAEKKEARQRHEKELLKSRHRSLSDATELTSTSPTLIESFDEPVIFDSTLTFESVRLSRPRKGEVHAFPVARMMLIVLKGKDRK